MAILENQPKAFGAPGIPPRWTRSAKDIVGTAYSTSSRIWYTASACVINEIYFPTIDLPQIRDLQFLVSDGEVFSTKNAATWPARPNTSTSMASRCASSRASSDRYRLIKEIIADPHLPCLLIDARLEADDPEILARLHLYVCSCRIRMSVDGARTATPR